MPPSVRCTRSSSRIRSFDLACVPRRLNALSSCTMASTKRSSGQCPGGPNLLTDPHLELWMGGDQGQRACDMQLHRILENEEPEADLRRHSSGSFGAAPF